MKYNPALISYFFQRESTKRNIRQLLKFLLHEDRLPSGVQIVGQFRENPSKDEEEKSLYDRLPVFVDLPAFPFISGLRRGVL